MTAAPILLDTCAAIWLMEGAPMAPAAIKAIDRAQRSESGVHVSPITAWEIGLLVMKKRVSLTIPVEEWFATLLGMPGVRLAPMPPDILIRSSCLPGAPPSDPADRIVAATAREYGLSIVTRDGGLVAYSRAGNIDLIAC